MSTIRCDTVFNADSFCEDTEDFLNSDDPTRIIVYLNGDLHMRRVDDGELEFTFEADLEWLFRSGNMLGAEESNKTKPS